MKKIWRYGFGGFALALGLATGVMAQEEGAVPSDRISPEAIERIAKEAAEDAAQKLLTKLKKEEQKIAKEKALKKKSHTPPDNHLMRIGSGAVGGNYFVLGELVGGVISHPDGSLPCGKGGTCGVPRLQTMNVTSAGSMANLEALALGSVSSAFVQSDVAYWAYTGTGLFEKKEKMKKLRAIASLYPEAVHIVVNKESGIRSVTDLKGKRVSVGARNSGTLLQARLVLSAYKLSEDDLLVEHLNNQQSIDKLTHGELDAMFFSVGVPAPALSQLFSEHENFSLLSLDAGARQDIFRQGTYFSPYVIAENTYPNVGKVETVSVFALWLCSSELSEKLVYQMTKALWSDASRQLLNSSYVGKHINVEHSLQGIGIPLHKGAKKYYNEIGKRY